MPAKAIPPARDRLQSRLLVWTLLPLLCLAVIVAIAGALLNLPYLGLRLLAILPASVVFALLAWRMKAATPSGALCGGMICMLVSYAPGLASSHRSGLPSLIALFLLTHLATRTGGQRKEAEGIAESRIGRRASQVIANLGLAGLLAFPFGATLARAVLPAPSFDMPADPFAPLTAAMTVMLAALSEATADTVSSEIGQAYGGTPILITTLRRVLPGTDGAISLAGTLAGIAGAAMIALTGMPALGMNLRECLVAFTAAVAGLFFDTLLGATLERRGWINNDLVNFTSTAFAASIALVTLSCLRNPIWR